MSAILGCVSRGDISSILGVILFSARSSGAPQAMPCRNLEAIVVRGLSRHQLTIPRWGRPATPVHYDS